MVGNTNLAAGQGNIFHDNLSKGIEVGIGVTVAGNTVYGQSTSGGIDQIDNACCSPTTSCGVTRSASTTPTMRTRSATTACSTIPSRHCTGWWVKHAGRRDLFQRRWPVDRRRIRRTVSDCSERSDLCQRVRRRLDHQFEQPSIAEQHDLSDHRRRGFDQHRVEQHLTAQNNILWSKGGYDIEVASTSENGFSADYNLFYTTNTGKVGFWDGIARSTLALWRTATATDTNSLYAQPLFVNVSSNDQSIGYSSGVDHGATDDFHDQSTGGSFHGGALRGDQLNLWLAGGAGTHSYKRMRARRPPSIAAIPPPPSPTNPPNGGFVNIGAYRNTAKRTDNATSYVVMLNPNGGESLIAGKNYTIKWRSQDTSSTVKIDLLQGSSPQTATVVSNIATRTQQRPVCLVDSVKHHRGDQLLHPGHTQRHIRKRNECSRVYDPCNRSRFLRQRFDRAGCTRSHNRRR